MIDFPLLVEALPLLLRGAGVTIVIAVSSCLIGLTLGVALALAHTSRNRALRYAVQGYAGFFRGTPMLVQILFAYYVLPQTGLLLPPLSVAIIAIGLNSAAYLSQSIRAGIEAVPAGQREAAQTLGMNDWQIRRYIILPQAFRIMLPVMGNEFITLVKDSSLASVIGVVELSKEGSILRSTTYDAFTIMLGVSAIYLSMITALTALLNYIERRTASHA
jgi:His/Glu/Gln/Arg/opine family amino acid ABC transporter permease subunit